MVNFSSTLKRNLRDLASELGANQAGRFICPSCHGGSTRERSLAITAYSHHMVYICFRGQCGLSGALSLADGVRQAAKVKPKPRPYGGDLLPVPEAIHNSVFAKYGLSPRDISDQGITYAPEINRIRFPMYNYMGYIFGENLRAVSPEQKPKTLINKFNDVPNLHFPLRQFIDTGVQSNLPCPYTADEIVLVEDQTSAIKVSQVAYCAALMGTNLSQDGVKQLLNLGVKKIVLMLDGDEAGLKASIKLKGQLSPFFIVQNVVLANNMDPKDISLNDLERMVLEAVSRKT